MAVLCPCGSGSLHYVKETFGWCCVVGGLDVCGNNSCYVSGIIPVCANYIRDIVWIILGGRL